MTEQIEISLKDGCTVVGGEHFLDDSLPQIRKLNRAIRQQQADIAELRAERDQLRAKSDEYKLAPTVAYVNTLSRMAPNYLIAQPLPPQLMPPIGTELIARPK